MVELFCSCVGALRGFRSLVVHGADIIPELVRDAHGVFKGTRRMRRRGSLIALLEQGKVATNQSLELDTLSLKVLKYREWRVESSGVLNVDSDRYLLL